MSNISVTLPEDKTPPCPASSIAIVHDAHRSRELLATAEIIEKNNLKVVRKARLVEKEPGDIEMGGSDKIPIPVTLSNGAPSDKDPARSAHGEGFTMSHAIDTSMTDAISLSTSTAEKSATSGSNPAVSAASGADNVSVKDTLVPKQTSSKGSSKAIKASSDLGGIFEMDCTEDRSKTTNGGSSASVFAGFTSLFNDTSEDPPSKVLQSQAPRKLATTKEDDEEEPPLKAVRGNKTQKPESVQPQITRPGAPTMTAQKPSVPPVPPKTKKVVPAPSAGPNNGIPKKVVATTAAPKPAPNNKAEAKYAAPTAASKAAAIKKPEPKPATTAIKKPAPNKPEPKPTTTSKAPAPKPHHPAPKPIPTEPASFRRPTQYLDPAHWQQHLLPAERQRMIRINHAYNALERDVRARLFAHNQHLSAAAPRPHPPARQPTRSELNEIQLERLRATQQLRGYTQLQAEFAHNEQARRAEKLQAVARAEEQRQAAEREKAQRRLGGRAAPQRKPAEEMTAEERAGIAGAVKRAAAAKDDREVVGPHRYRELLAADEARRMEALRREREAAGEWRREPVRERRLPQRKRGREEEAGEVEAEVVARKKEGDRKRMTTSEAYARSLEQKELLTKEWAVKEKLRVEAMERRKQEREAERAAKAKQRPRRW